MSVLIHLVYVLAYTVTAVTVGAMVLLLPDSPPILAALTAAVVFLAGALLHEVMARLAGIRAARHRAALTADAMEALHNEVVHLRGAVERLSGGGAGYDTVVQEVKLLQNLVGRLYTARSGTKPAPARPSVPPRPGRAAGGGTAGGSGGPLVAGQAPRLAADAGPLDDAGVLEAVREGLRADRIDVYLQPIVSLPQRKHRSYEVFTRVRAADGTQIMPDRYLDIAEREGLIATIDNLLLIRCVQLIRETERRQHQITFFCNISAATLGDGEFMADFLHLMGRNPSLVPKLIFELGQEDLRSGPATTMAVLGQLARIGFHFSLDQVADPAGVEVEALARADFRYLKLDAGLLRDPATRAAAASLMQRCRRHEIDVILEKIETEQQLAALTDLDPGIDFGQGYLFGEPRLSRRPD